MKLSDDRREQLSAYLDGELSATEQQAFEKSLAENETLARELESMKRLSTYLRDIQVPKASSVVSEVLTALQPKQTYQGKRKMSTSPKFKYTLIFATAAACLAIVAAVVYLNQKPEEMMIAQNQSAPKTEFFKKESAPASRAMPTQDPSVILEKIFKKSQEVGREQEGKGKGPIEPPQSKEGSQALLAILQKAQQNQKPSAAMQETVHLVGHLAYPLKAANVFAALRGASGEAVDGVADSRSAKKGQPADETVAEEADRDDDSGSQRLDLFFTKQHEEKRVGGFIYPKAQNPIFPAMALDELNEGKFGSAKISFTIDSNGNVKDVRSTDASKVPQIKPVMDALKNVNFTPARVNFKPTAVNVTIEFPDETILKFKEQRRKAAEK